MATFDIAAILRQVKVGVSGRFLARAEWPEGMEAISESELFAHIGKRYDVTALSSRQARELAHELNEQGLINNQEFAALNVVGARMGATHDVDAPRNYLQRLDNCLTLAKVYSTPADVQALEKVQKVLQRLDTARCGR